MGGQAKGQAKFRQIADSFRTRILSGELRPGDEVPSERSLAAEYGVSRPTATKALELLRTQGVVHSIQGSGTYVADLAINRRANERYARSRSAGRIYAGNERAEIVAAEIVEDPPEPVVRGLDLPPRTAAIRRRRITWDGEEQVEVSTSWLSAELAATAPRLLSTARIRAGTMAYVEERTGRVGAYARDRTAARVAGKTDAKDLGLPRASTPVLVVEHTVYDQQDRPLEFVQAVYPPDRWTYEQLYDLT